jgi:hypothetical protein
MNVGFHLSAIFEKSARVPHLEIEVVIVSVGSEADFLDHRLDRIGLQLLFPLFLLVKKLLVVDDLGNRWLSVRADFYQVKINVTGPLLRTAGFVYLTGANLEIKLLGNVRNVITDKADFRCPNHIIDPVFWRSIFSAESAFAAAAFTSTQKVFVFN